MDTEKHRAASTTCCSSVGDRAAKRSLFTRKEPEQHHQNKRYDICMMCFVSRIICYEKCTGSSTLIIYRVQMGSKHLLSLCLSILTFHASEIAHRPKKSDRVGWAAAPGGQGGAPRNWGNTSLPNLIRATAVAGFESQHKVSFFPSLLLCFCFVLNTVLLPTLTTEVLLRTKYNSIIFHAGFLCLV